MQIMQQGSVKIVSVNESEFELIGGGQQHVFGYRYVWYFREFANFLVVGGLVVWLIWNYRKVAKIYIENVSLYYRIVKM